ncbi:AAA family ATPase [Arenivirga flava]|nr:AAA family ATPase [Arenivirga flava]
MTDARDPALEAVLSLPPEASAVVLGAPGTGKTGALLGLLERRLAQGALAADEAVILAPSRQAATRLRDVAGVRLGVPTNGPLVRTVTSLAFDLVGAARLEAGLEPPRLLSGAEQDRVIAELLAGEAEERATRDGPGASTRRCAACADSGPSFASWPCA